MAMPAVQVQLEQLRVLLEATNKLTAELLKRVKEIEAASAE